ncbi:hypothetical protein L1987_63478 [Smallanthus sonchifolius]|uniref:Uncharacterized protein n=1 Tax=Smallanthus sonchifolius TaxID=185202 RepID=A0ACB9CDD2_9ASTR|nr:hypothetical protein L1987_63478 [Smallanthus sonchifolius]
MLLGWFSKAVRRLVQLYVQGPLGAVEYKCLCVCSHVKQLYTYETMDFGNRYNAPGTSLQCFGLYLSVFRETSPHLLTQGDGSKSATITSDVHTYPFAKVHPTAKNNVRKYDLRGFVFVDDVNKPAFRIKIRIGILVPSKGKQIIMFMDYDVIKMNVLEYYVGMREEKLGTSSSDVDDEKRRLAQLLKNASRDRSKKDLSFEFLLDG